MLSILQRVLDAGKCLEGHSAGASEKKLMAYLVPGISSCHEPINARQVLDRLGDAIRQLVVNSAVHGIEDVDTRLGAGKPGTGSIRIDPKAICEALKHTGTSRLVHSARLGVIDR